MSDVDEIIEYIKSLKKGFDKHLFLSKIEELAHIVDVVGIEYDDFHTLFKVWLNLSISITKWQSIGLCLVSREIVQKNTVQYGLRWLLDNFQKPTSFSRISFVLDWLTVALDCNSIDMETLDSGYEIFYMMLTYEILTPHALKLVYTLTKPSDVTRRRVLEIFNLAKKREGKKNMFRQLQVLLGLFKSYRPECVPEDIPAISIHTAFKKLNVNLLNRFKASQSGRQSTGQTRHHLLWSNPQISERTNKKVEHLVPSIEFMNIGSNQYADNEEKKNYLDFTEPVSLLQYSLKHCPSRPAKLRALLCNETGLALLAVADKSQLQFMCHDLRHLLSGCFLDGSSHSYAEKSHLLHKLALLQRTMLQGIPVITGFLAQYLPLWDERDYFPQILELAEWLSADSPNHVTYVVDTLARVYHRSHPMQQCAILNSLCKMYCNMVYTSTNKQNHFISSEQSKRNCELLLPHVAASIAEMCNKGLQFAPEDMRVLYSSVRASRRMTSVELSNGASLGSLPGMLTLTLPLVSVSASLVDKVAGMILLYKQIMKSMKTNQKNRKDPAYVNQIQTLQGFTSDMVRCLFVEEALSHRQMGLIFHKMHPQLVSKLETVAPDVDGKLSLRNHLAFAAYTYMRLEAIDECDADNRLFFDTVIDEEFEDLSDLLKKTVPELR